MLFKTMLIQKIAAGEKRQTRRPVKDGDIAITRTIDNAIDRVAHNGRDKWVVGRTLAVQPGRGKPTVWYHGTTMLDYEKRPTPATEMAMAIGGFVPLYIRITSIRREDVRLISHEDAVAEGFNDALGFLAVWTGFYDKRMAFVRVADSVFPPDDPTYQYVNRKEHYTDDLVLLGELSERPGALYDAFALTFEVAS